MSFFVENEIKIIQKKAKKTEVAQNDVRADDKQGFFFTCLINQKITPPEV